MRSMTGFGRGTAENETATVTVDVKTVNNRFLDINLRVPQELAAIENEIRAEVAARLSRGRVDLSVQLDRGQAAELEPNDEIINSYLAAIARMQSVHGLKGEADINTIVRLPHVFRQKRLEMDDGIRSAVMAAVDQALSDLVAMRENEGEMMAAVLRECLRQIAVRIPKIESLTAAVTDEYQARLSKRIEDMLARSGFDPEIDKGRLIQEAAYLADRADISEEVARLKAHLGHFEEIMAEQKDVGKRLDFLAQELNREANTVSSKTTNMIVKENALAIKSEIEKIREQVQNIE